jgi:hypothetical protein
MDDFSCHCHVFSHTKYSPLALPGHSGNMLPCATCLIGHMSLQCHALEPRLNLSLSLFHLLQEQSKMRERRKELGLRKRES